MSREGKKKERKRGRDIKRKRKKGKRETGNKGKGGGGEKRKRGRRRKREREGGGRGRGRGGEPWKRKTGEKEERKEKEKKEKSGSKIRSHKKILDFSAPFFPWSFCPLCPCFFLPSFRSFRTVPLLPPRSFFRPPPFLFLFLGSFLSFGFFSPLLFILIIIRNTYKNPINTLKLYKKKKLLLLHKKI